MANVTVSFNGQLFVLGLSGFSHPYQARPRPNAKFSVQEQHQGISWCSAQKDPETLEFIHVGCFFGSGGAQRSLFSA